MSELYPFAPRHAPCRRFRMHYVDEGAGEPVVLVHGNPTWSFYFRSLILGLRDSHRCIAPDHLGCGRSDHPSEDQYDFSLRSRVDDFAQFMEHLQLREPVTLVVHDWGGMIGTAWAARNPDRVCRLIAINTGAFHLPRTKRFPWSLWLGRNSQFGAWLIRQHNLFCEAALRWCVTRTTLSEPVRAMYREPYDTWERRISVLKFVQTIPLRPGDEGYELVSEVQGRLKDLRHLPVQLQWGLRDFVFDAHFLAEWVRRFPQAEVHRYPDCGHYLLEDAPGEVLARVKAFLERTR